MKRPEDFGTETATRHGDLSRTPQRAARSKAKELRAIATELREFVHLGKVETYKPESRSQSGKLLCKEGIRVEGITAIEGLRIIQEAERLELLAALTLEGMGIANDTQCTRSKSEK